MGLKLANMLAKKYINKIDFDRLPEVSIPDTNNVA